MKMKKQTNRIVITGIALSTAIAVSGGAETIAPVLSRSFELRYVTENRKACGESDFNGPTSIFSTEQRVEYLKHYA